MFEHTAIIIVHEGRIVLKCQVNVAKNGKAINYRTVAPTRVRQKGNTIKEHFGKRQGLKIRKIGKMEGRL